MTLSCSLCGQQSGTSLVCVSCLPQMNDHQKSKTMRAWHRIIVERAHNACEECGHSATFDSGELCGDHIETQGARPDLRYDINNSFCRCLPCHTARHNGSSPILPHAAMDKEKRKPKRSSCSYFSCALLPLHNGRCLQHQAHTRQRKNDDVNEKDNDDLSADTRE